MAVYQVSRRHIAAREDALFAFEMDFAGTLRCIPMAVRRKLDLAGIKLSLRQWSRFTREDRRHLLETPCVSAAEIAFYRAELVRLIAERAKEEAKTLGVEAAPVWSRADAVPAVVEEHARSLGLVPPSPAQWRGLTELQRFALVKLTREGHDNENFLPAMREFGLCAVQKAG